MTGVEEGTRRQLGDNIVAIILRAKCGLAWRINMPNEAVISEG